MKFPWWALILIISGIIMIVVGLNNQNKPKPMLQQSIDILIRPTDSYVDIDVSARVFGKNSSLAIRRTAAELNSLADQIDNPNNIHVFLPLSDTKIQSKTEHTIGD